jgi:hypothetical protein
MVKSMAACGNRRPPFLEVSNANTSGWKAKLIALGIEVVEGIPIPGYDRFEFRDPFGNRVEFMERR